MVFILQKSKEGVYDYTLLKQSYKNKNGTITTSF